MSNQRTSQPSKGGRKRHHDGSRSLQESALSDPVRRLSGNGRERLWSWSRRVAGSASPPALCITPWIIERSQSEFRKAIRLAWAVALRFAKLLRAAWPWPAWARIACGECTRPAVVEETRDDADAPERCRPHLRLAGSRLSDAVSQATHVVEQEVGEREERDLV